MRCARSPWRAWRWTTDSCISPSRVRALARQSWATVERAALTTSASPATWVRSSSPTAADRSSEATARQSATVRTLWSRRTPASQIGIPELVGEGADLLAGEAAWVVHQHQVVVAERSAVAAGERADGGEGDTFVPAPGARLAPQLLEPPEPELRERPAAGLARAGRREGPGAGEVQTS